MKTCYLFNFLAKHYPYVLSGEKYDKILAAEKELQEKGSLTFFDGLTLKWVKGRIVAEVCDE